MDCQFFSFSGALVPLLPGELCGCRTRSIPGGRRGSRTLFPRLDTRKEEGSSSGYLQDTAVRALLKAVQPALCLSVVSGELSGDVLLPVGLFGTLFSCLSPAWGEAASRWLWTSRGEYMSAHTLSCKVCACC